MNKLCGLSLCLINFSQPHRFHESPNFFGLFYVQISDSYKDYSGHSKFRSLMSQINDFEVGFCVIFMQAKYIFTKLSQSIDNLTKLSENNYSFELMGADSSAGRAYPF